MNGLSGMKDDGADRAGGGGGGKGKVELGVRHGGGRWKQTMKRERAVGDR